MQVDYYFVNNKIYNSCTYLNTSQLNDLKNRSKIGYIKYVILIFDNNIVGKYFDLHDINDYKYIMTKKNNLNLIHIVSYYGHCELLEWFYNNNKKQFKFKYSENAIDNASQNGHLNVIEWFYNKKDQFEFKYSNGAIDNASLNGHLNVIGWFYNKKDQIQFKYSENAINWASEKRSFKCNRLVL